MADKNAVYELRHVEEQKRIMSEIGESIHSDLVSETSNGRCNTDVFEQYFLPIILGERKDTSGQWIARWQTVARTLSNKVDIYDNNDRFLFTVPPLLNTFVLKDRREEDALDAILREYQARNTNPLANADDYLLGAFGDTYGKILNGYNDEAEVKQWKVILKYYGKLDDEGFLLTDPNRKNGVVVQQQQEQPEESPDDFLSFD